RLLSIFVFRTSTCSFHLKIGGIGATQDGRCELDVFGRHKKTAFNSIRRSPITSRRTIIKRDTFLKSVASLRCPHFRPKRACQHKQTPTELWGEDVPNCDRGNTTKPLNHTAIAPLSTRPSRTISFKTSVPLSRPVLSKSLQHRPIACVVPGQLHVGHIRSKIPKKSVVGATEVRPDDPRSEIPVEIAGVNSTRSFAGFGIRIGVVKSITKPHVSWANQQLTKKTRNALEGGANGWT
ncbi:unnamed protein product, partial [Ectocarpus sp. 12 AP-2014]